MRKGRAIAIFLLAVSVSYGSSQQANTAARHHKKQKSSAARTVTPQTAQSETTQNTAGSIAGNSGAIGATTGDTKPQDATTPQKSAAGNNAPATNQPTTEGAQQSQPAAEATGEKHEAAANGIAMLPDTDSKTLQGEIDSALKSDPSLANSQLTVDVNDSQIVVNGTVPGGKEKLTATRIVQSYAGNRRVQDKINVAGRTQAPASGEQPKSMGTNQGAPKK